MNVRLLAAACAALLAACGSDSKKSPPAGRSVAYSGPTAPAAFDAQTNTTQLVAGVAVIAQGFGGDMSGALAFGAGVTPRRTTVQNVLLLAGDALRQPAVAVAAGAVRSNPSPCANNVGSRTATISQATPGVTSANDYVEMSFSGCADESGALTDGSFRVTFDTVPAGALFAADPTQITADQTFGITLAFSNLVNYDPSTTAWDGTNGSLSLTFAASMANATLTFTISSPLLEGGSGVGSTSEYFRMTALSDVAVAVYDHLGAGATATGARWDLDGRVCATDMGGCANIVTNPVFVQTAPNAYPDSGSIRISDDAGDYVQVTATGGGGAQVGWSINGSAGTSTTSWAALEAEAAP